MSDKILLVEDEAKIARTVRLYLEQAGYSAVTVQDGAQALPAFRHERPDLVILDLSLPHVDGLEICRQLRQEYNVPIIMLTARSEEVDRLIGLELGADDYIAKPFSPREVVARVRAVLRRSRGQSRLPALIRAGDLIVDPERHAATLHDEKLDLTPTEFQLLTEFARYPGRVFTRLQLLDAIQDAAYEGYERIIDQHIKNLRTKLRDDAKNPRYIETVFGIGYKLLAGEKQDA